MGSSVRHWAEAAAESEVAAAMDGCSVKENVVIAREDDDGVGGVRQGLTLVHYSPERKHFLRDT